MRGNSSCRVRYCELCHPAPFSRRNSHSLVFLRSIPTDASMPMVTGNFCSWVPGIFMKPVDKFRRHLDYPAPPPQKPIELNAVTTPPPIPVIHLKEAHAAKQSPTRSSPDGNAKASPPGSPNGRPPPPPPIPLPAFWFRDPDTLCLGMVDFECMECSVARGLALNCPNCIIYYSSFDSLFTHQARMVNQSRLVSLKRRPETRAPIHLRQHQMPDVKFPMQMSNLPDDSS